MGMEVAGPDALKKKKTSVDDFTICAFGNRGHLYGMGNHLKIQTKSIFKRFYDCFVAVLLKVLFFQGCSRKMTLAVHGRRVIWCPELSRWRRKLYSLYGKMLGA